MLRNCNVQNPWIQQRADPYVYKHKDGNYYFTASVPTYDRLVFRKSDTLDGLSKAPETVIWTKHEEGIMEFPIVKDTTPNMMNPRLYTTSYNKP